MTEIVNKFLLAGDKFTHEMHLKQPAFIYSACRLFTKNKERIEKSKETGDSRYIYIKTRKTFQLDMAYGDFKDLARRTASDKVLRDKAINIAKNPKYDGYQRGLVSMVYKCFDKKSKGSFKSAIKNKIKRNEQLAEKLHKPIIRKFEKRKIYSLFKDNIWGPDLADMQLISKSGKGILFLSCVIDILSKYA